MIKNKAFRFRLYPTTEQEILLQKTFGCVRFVWNNMLGDNINYYNTNKKSSKLNSPATYKKNNEFLKEVDSLALCNEYLSLTKAFKSFFNKKTGFPKFKSKKTDKKSYTTYNQNNGIRLHNSTIRLPKLGFVKLRLHRQIPQDHVIKSVTVSQVPSGKYYVSVLVEYDKVVTGKTLDKHKSIGLDYSSTHFYVDNQGVVVDSPKYFKKYQNKLSKEQRKLSRMNPGSNNYKKQGIKVARVYEKIANSRKNWLNNLSRHLVNMYDIICVEGINLTSIAKKTKTHKLGKATLDNSFGMFREMLRYKLEEAEGRLVIVDKWFHSSKLCNMCGHVNKNLKLSTRTWKCPNCGTIHDRDINAAINIHREGLKLI